MNIRKKITQREFWPRYILYIPIYIYYLWLSIKSGSLMFPYLANPGMPPVSILQFSKWDLLKQLPSHYLPKTQLITTATPHTTLDQITKNIGFPCIVKPDIGERGNGVALIKTLQQLTTYLATANPNETYLLQEFCDFPLEFGVMRYRLLDRPIGHISGIVSKEPCMVTGDGQHTLEQLVIQDERTNRYYDIFARNNTERWHTIIATGESVQLTFIANHNKGTIFLDRSDLITDQLINSIDQITNHIDGFSYGRLDIKVPTINDLLEGTNIKIIEINGIQSEPAHIYDPTYPLIKGYQQLFHHRGVLYQIARQHHRAGISYNLFGTIRQHIFPPKNNQGETMILQKTAQLVEQYFNELTAETRNPTHYLSPQQLDNELDVGVSIHATSDTTLLQECKKILDYSVATQHPFFFNQLFAGADQYAIAGERLSAVMNSSMYTYEMSPVLLQMEQEIFKQYAHLLGRKTYAGLMPSGGSVGNQYALQFARYKLDPQTNQAGIYQQQPYAIFTSDQSHYSIKKAAMLMGMGQASIITIPTNSAGSMQIESLKSAINTAQKQGKQPLMINATAGSTVLGSFDDITQLGAVAKQYNIWLHIDAARGGAVLFSEQHKNLLAGIEHADSFTTNPHKALGVPLQCTVFLTQHTTILENCNRCQAEYLFQSDKCYDIALDTGDNYVQCGRKNDIFKLWLLWKAKGTHGLTERIQKQLSIATYAYQQLQNDERFLVYPHQPHRNNICLRYIPSELRGTIHTIQDLLPHYDTIQQLTAQMKHHMLKSGKIMMNYQPVKEFPNAYRWVFINPDLTPHQIDQVIKHLAEIGDSVAQQQ